MNRIRFSIAFKRDEKGKIHSFYIPTIATNRKKLNIKIKRVLGPSNLYSYDVELNGDLLKRHSVLEDAKDFTQAIYDSFSENQKR